MKRILSAGPSTKRPANPTLAGTNVAGADASSNEKKKGFLHLLKNHTLADIARLLAGDPMRRDAYLDKFLRDGALPESAVCRSMIAEWLLEHREADVFLAMLDITPMSINVSNVERARTLLEMVHKTQSISGLELTIPSLPRDAFPAQTIQLLAEAIALDKGLDTLNICGNDFRRNGLSPLLDALRCVGNLALTTLYSQLGLHDLGSLAELAEQNKKIRRLDLSCRVPDLLQGVCPYPEAMNYLLAELKTQTGLKQLGLADVPRACQGQLGNLISGNHALTSLKISLHGPDATEPLIAGLSQNSALEHLSLDVDGIEDGMLPLITMLAHNTGRLSQFVLETRNGRGDEGDSFFIAALISGNATISEFTWRFRDHKNTDLALLGSALESNSTLETIVLEKTGFGLDETDMSTDWLDEKQLPVLAARLGRNRTLTKLDFRDQYYPSNMKRMRPELDAIMERNLSYQRYACSEGFIEGAAQGFFAALNMPPELGQPTAPYLLAQKPRIRAASLALVDKTTLAWALGRRREQSAEVMKTALAAGERNDADAAARMAALLRRIVATPLDFSEDALREVARSPLIGQGLASIMENRPASYQRLLTLLGEAAGFDLIRTLVMMEIGQRRNVAATPDA
jgi:hypothetical protein